MISQYTYLDRQGMSPKGINYLDFFTIVFEALGPTAYLEIGTNEGNSLEAFRCDALCIDPCFRVQGAPIAGRSRALFFQMTSDYFFTHYRVRDYFPNGPDVCFLDGLHKFEFLLRDFINAEAACRKNSIIFLHDCLPTNERMAEREMRFDETEDVRTRGAWTGDVWRILPALKKFRPDLRVLLLDCAPTGLVACTGLDPKSTVLSENYNSIVDEVGSYSLGSVGIDGLWAVFPAVDTRKLCSNRADISGILSIY